MSVIAIGLAKAGIWLDVPIHHGSVTDMPFDARRNDGVYFRAMPVPRREPVSAPGHAGRRYQA
jgi:hypothetical protein